MRVAVAGGTGTLGDAVTRELAGAGADVVVLSRTQPSKPVPGSTHLRVDLAAGDGLAAALEGCDAVVDAVNPPPSGRYSRFLVEASERLLAAGASAGVTHLVLASIVGCDRVPLGYYRSKVDQEEAAARSPLATTIVRATQFHALLDWSFAKAARVGILALPQGRLQPIDHREAARVVAEVVRGGPGGGTVEVGGPEVVPIRDLARAWKQARGSRALVAPAPLPGRIGRALRSGALTNPDAAAQGTATFPAWLARRS